MNAIPYLGGEFSKTRSGAVNLSFLNDGNVFAGLNELLTQRIEIKNLSKSEIISVPVRFSERSNNNVCRTKKTKKLSTALYTAFVHLTDNIISLSLLFILKILQKIVNFSCLKLEKYRLKMEYSDEKEDVRIAKRLHPLS